MEEEYRNLYENLVKEKTLGPGYAKELIFVDDIEHEVISQRPDKIYITGLMGPQVVDLMATEDSAESQDQGDIAEDDINNENDVHPINEPQENQDEKDLPDTPDNRIEIDKKFLLADHMGLITCISNQTTRIRINLQYAKYYALDNILAFAQGLVKVRLGSEVAVFQELIGLYSDNEEVREFLTQRQINRTFNELFAYNQEHQTVTLTQAIDFREYDENQQIDNDRTRANKRLFHLEHLHLEAERKNYFDSSQELLDLLLNGKFYKRTPYNWSCDYTIPVERENEEQRLDVICNGITQGTILLKVFHLREKTFLKVLFQNAAIAPTTGNRNLHDLIFQPEVEVITLDGHFVGYSNQENELLEVIGVDGVEDSEQKQIDYSYRKVKNYGKGVVCALTWEREQDVVTSVKTTYLPTSDVKSFSQEIDRDFYQNKLNLEDDTIFDRVNQTCNLYNLSHWQTNNQEYLNRLREFVTLFNRWFETQRAEAELEPEWQIQYDTILGKQQVLLDRLNRNVHYLETNPNVLADFKLANTAMLIQMTIARDENFRKNRPQETITQGEDILDNINYFANQRTHKYRPFQLAFLLMNVESIYERQNCPDRDAIVDLIWFPTGGGKTEAYLALSALTIIARRHRGETGAHGVSIIMRYTLRLLTSQQFERASYLTAALEFLRNQQDNPFNLGNSSITVGLWVGKATTPNHTDDLRHGAYSRFREKNETNNFGNNPFPVTYCPWCGARLTGNNYQANGAICCPNQHCHFGTTDQLPIDYIDNRIYNQPPTILFATVDKLAQFYRQDPKRLVGIGNNYDSPDLIIQDELHLISGPLGSLVGLFETVVEKMIARGGVMPKIIASTATTRNTDELIRKLYNRAVCVFPAQGITYDDNFFSHVKPSSLRRHVGISFQTKAVDAEISLIANLLLAKISLFRKYLTDNNIDIQNENAVQDFLFENNLLRDPLDLYWSLVLYYHSLKDLGRSRSRISQEIASKIRPLRKYYRTPKSLDFVISGFDSRVQEFTSREDSSRIKALLNKAESRTCINQRGRIQSGMDLVLATNMISVGIDINRWNVMMMVGMPRSTAEYIQSTSRVARSHFGLVINTFSNIRNRECSLFENFTSYHDTYYKFVEPLSSTPLTVQTLKHNLINNILSIYNEVFPREDLVADLTRRFHLPQAMEESARNIIEPVEPAKNNINNAIMAQSLRDIENDTLVQIESVSYRR